MKAEEVQKQIDAIDAIFDCTGYLETEGDKWLGPRLIQVRDFLANLRNRIEGTA